VIYTNLNETEIEKIKAILDSCKVQYKVSENEMALRALTEGDTYKQTQKSGRRGMPIMQIEIEQTEFAKIPQNLKGRLHGLGVFEDMENPFSEEELHTIANRVPEEPKSSEETVQEKMKHMVGILIVLALGALYLVYKEGGF
jgi:negative regulator of replication initiation